MSKYTALFVSDIHLGWKLYNEPELEQDMREVFRNIIDESVKRKVTYLVIVGDLFDDNTPSSELIDWTAAQVRKALVAGVKVIGISGDHDKPTRDVTWGSIVGVEPVTNHPYFVGRDYSDVPKDITDYIVNYQDKENVEWILAHGQEPSLFPFVDEKKKLEFKELPLATLYPKARGIILGDIHNPIEGTYMDKGKTLFIGYCGSPGVVKSDEIGKKRGLLYFDGYRIERIPFPLPREYVKIDFKGEAADKFDINLYLGYKDQPKKPVFRVEYNKASEDKTDRLRELYQFGIVKTIKVKADSEGKEEQINIRTELSTEDRVAFVLRQEVSNDEVYKIGLSLLTTPENTAAILDELKKEKLG